MVKVEVLNDFIDKNTKELHEKGSSFSCSNERFNEIQSVGNFVKIIAEIKAEKPAEKAEKAEKPEKPEAEKKSAEKTTKSSSKRKDR